MEDRNCPVTGYPAPNPPANGYPVNPPPPATATGSAYAYAAPPPAQPNGYYNNYYRNNYHPQYYQQDPDAIRRATCLRRIFAFTIAVIVIFGTVTFIVWLVLRPQAPEFRVDSLTLSNFTIENGSLVSFTSQIGLTARNPNKKMSLDFDEMSALLFYRDGELARTTVAPFYQDTRNETSLTARFAAAGSFVDNHVVRGINDEREKKGNVNLNLRMGAYVSFETRAWRARTRFVKVLCGDLIAGIPINGTSGTLIGGPKQCRVGI